jgi:hypothetical protein
MPALRVQVVAVCESDTDLLINDIECGNCGQMSGEPDDEAMDDYKSSQATKDLLASLNIPIEE